MLGLCMFTEYGTVTSTTKSREFRIFVGDEAVGDKFVNTESLKSTHVTIILPRPLTKHLL